MARGLSLFGVYVGIICECCKLYVRLHTAIVGTVKHGQREGPGCFILTPTPVSRQKTRLLESAHQD